MSVRREHLFNADFDLSLRAPGPIPAGARRAAAEMPLHAALVPEPGDSLLCPEPLPDELLERLEDAGLGAPVVTVPPAIRAERELVPFGWNEDAAELARRYAHPAEHPPLEVVERVNRRTYSAALEAELGGERGVVVADLGQLRSALRAAGGELVAKAEHGNAAAGNRRLRPPELGPADERWAAAVLRAGPLVVERWRDRVADLCATAAIAPDGTVSEVGVHTVQNTADGAFVGAIFGRTPTLERWADEVAETAAGVGAQLARNGYFGPVAVDAFVYREGGAERLRPIVDINARAHVSAGARRVWRTLGGERALVWRFVTVGRASPATGDVGADRYDRERRRGVLVTSPIGLASGRRVRRIGVLSVGADVCEALTLAERARRRIGR